MPDPLADETDLGVVQRKVIQVALTHEIAVRVGVRVPPDSVRIRTERPKLRWIIRDATRLSLRGKKEGRKEGREGGREGRGEGGRI